MTPFREAVERIGRGPGLDDDAALLDEALGDLAGDELDVVGVIIERLKLGRERYGQLDIASDPRDWCEEAREEAADTPIYLAIETLKAAMRP